MKKGFTLVELLVVIAILAILATVSVVGYTSFINDANNSVAQQELTQVRDYVIAKEYLETVVVDADLLEELGLEGEIETKYDDNHGKYYVYTATNDGVAYWNEATGVISTDTLELTGTADHVYDPTSGKCVCGDEKPAGN